MSRSERPGRHPVHAASGHPLGAARPRQELPADLRLVAPALAAWGAAALAPGLPPALAAAAVTVCLAAAAAVSGTAAAARRRGRAPRVTLAAVLLCAAASGAVAALHAAAARAGPLPEAGPGVVTAEVTVTAVPRLARASGGRPGAVLIEAEATSVRLPGGARQSVRTPVLLVTRPERADPWLALLPSTRLRVTATTARPVPGRDPELTAVLRATGTGPPQVTSPPGRWHRLAGELRASLTRAARELPGDAAGLLPALVIGDDSGMPPDLTEAVRATGLTHLVVVSGAQVALVLGVLIGPAHRAARAERGGLAPRLGLPLRATAVLGAGLLAGFVLVCGPDPSVLRAAACGGLVLLAMATGRERAALPALAAAVLLLVLLDPTLARSFGFLLSVLATGALLLLAPPWARSLRRRGLPQRVAGACAAAVAAHVVCAPVIVVFAAQVSLVAVPCNLLAAPAAAPAVVLGWAALATAPLCPPLAESLAWLASWPAGWIARVARTGAALPGAEAGWPGGWRGAALLAALTVALLTLARRGPRRPLAVLAALVLLLAVVRPAPLPRVLTGWPPPGWRLVACDVGQGDALVLNAGGGSALVVDTGPDPAAVDRCLTDLGVRHVPLLVLTHYHADHVAGLPGVLRGRDVGAIQASAVRDSPEQAAFAERIAAAAGVELRPAVPGERYRLGEHLSWEVLWPPSGAGAAGLAANDASVTLLVRARDLTLLLPGDLEPSAQRQLLARHPGLPAVDVLKVPHHGSARQHPELLDRLDPALALITCGEDNRYGHPAPSTLDALRAAGATVLRTDVHGTLALTADGGIPRGHARGHR